MTPQLHTEELYARAACTAAEVSLSAPSAPSAPSSHLHILQVETAGREHMEGSWCHECSLTVTANHVQRRITASYCTQVALSHWPSSHIWCSTHTQKHTHRRRGGERVQDTLPPSVTHKDRNRETHQPGRHRRARSAASDSTCSTHPLIQSSSRGGESQAELRRRRSPKRPEGRGWSQTDSSRGQCCMLPYCPLYFFLQDDSQAALPNTHTLTHNGVFTTGNSYNIRWLPLFTVTPRWCWFDQLSDCPTHIRTFQTWISHLELCSFLLTGIRF